MLVHRVVLPQPPLLVRHCQSDNTSNQLSWQTGQNEAQSSSAHLVDVRAHNVSAASEPTAQRQTENPDSDRIDAQSKEAQAAGPHSGQSPQACEPTVLVHVVRASQPPLSTRHCVRRKDGSERAKNNETLLEMCGDSLCSSDLVDVNAASGAGASEPGLRAQKKRHSRISKRGPNRTMHWILRIAPYRAGGAVAPEYRGPCLGR